MKRQKKADRLAELDKQGLRQSAVIAPPTYLPSPERTCLYCRKPIGFSPKAYCSKECCRLHKEKK